MNAWLETLGVVLVAFSGVFLGKKLSALRKPYWLIGYFFPMAIIAFLAAIRFNDSLNFVAPFSWLVMGRLKFIAIAMAVTVGLTTPLSRLPHKSERVLLCFLMTIVVVWFCIFPFLFPALINKNLSHLETKFDSNGICYQTTDYTCGPAAAVTALRTLGLKGQEGEIAILAHTTPVTGTLPGCLYSALEKRYRDQGLKCKYRHFDSVEQLKGASVTLVMVKDSTLSDHCVAVLDVSQDKVTIADPVFGKMLMSHEQFSQIWRYSGIVLERPGMSI